MTSRWQWLIRQFARKLWVRVSIFSVAAVIVALAGVFLAPYVPQNLASSIGSDSIDDILKILASSMLAVSTFSLATMVSAYSAVSSSVTPRASKLLMDDTTAQNALGTFIGSFLFSLVGIVALSTGLYGQQGRLILFVATTVIIVLIVVTMLRWIDYLSRLGRVGETIDRVEQATRRALEERVAHPALGARRLDDPARIPQDAMAVFAEGIGYVQHIDIGTLADCAGDGARDIYVTAQAGTFADRLRPLARIAGPLDDDTVDRVRAAFTVGDGRSFDQDPRFGLCVLAEIASRALSPAVNDPGTAIDVVGRGERLLSRWAEGRDEPADRSDDAPPVYVPPIEPDDMFDDIFAPVARDGAGLVEVQIRLQKVLRSLAASDDRQVSAAAKRHSRLALARAEKALAMEHEINVLRALAEETRQF
jgi:uncharacterized membrane protein